MKKLFFTAVIIAATTSTVHSADLIKKSSPILVAPVPVSNWSGFYVGAGVGAAINQREFNARFTNAFNKSTYDTTAFRGTIFAGYNWQFQNIVAGVEADAAYSPGGKKTINSLPGAGFGALANPDRSSVDTSFDGSFRLRAGYLITPSFLLYGTGGLAIQTAELKSNCLATGPWCIANRVENNSKTHIGYTVGAGAELKLTSNWNARLEYRYSDFGNVKYNIYSNAPIDTVSGSLKNTSHFLTAGVSYKF